MGAGKARGVAPRAGWLRTARRTDASARIAKRGRGRNPRAQRCCLRPWRRAPNSMAPPATPAARLRARRHTRGPWRRNLRTMVEKQTLATIFAGEKPLRRLCSQVDAPRASPKYQTALPLPYFSTMLRSFRRHTRILIHPRAPSLPAFSSIPRALPTRILIHPRATPVPFSAGPWSVPLLTHRQSPVFARPPRGGRRTTPGQRVFSEGFSPNNGLRRRRPGDGADRPSSHRETRESTP